MNYSTASVQFDMSIHDTMNESYWDRQKLAAACCTDMETVVVPLMLVGHNSSIIGLVENNPMLLKIILFQPLVAYKL